MSRALRDFRLLPLVLLATVALLVLKSFGLLFDGGYLLGSSAGQGNAKSARTLSPDGGDIVGSIPALATQVERTVVEEPLVTAPVVSGGRLNATPARHQSWAQEMFNFPDITGSVGAQKDATPAKGAAPAPKATPAAKGAASDKETAPKDGAAAPPVELDKPLGMPNTRPVSPSERALLERLQERRKSLEARARELDMRETLLKATEKQLETRVKELKQATGRSPRATQGAKQDDKQGDKQDEESAERLKGLVSMYENMKAKDAARIFDRLDLRILAELAGQINPRRMADILANMSSEAAERLTVEFANRGNMLRSPAPADLPKIEGRPNPGP
jgi:flagellar motility protein MotE (MotC chaperone)